MIPFVPGGLLSPEFGKEIDEAGLDSFLKFWGDSPAQPAKDIQGLDPECEEEWRYARAYCVALLAARRLGRRFSGLGRTLDECMRGQVSERCGGNRVEWGSRAARRAT